MSWGSKERRERKFKVQGGLCHWCKKPMVLTRGNGKSGSIPGNYATFEHLQRVRDGGAGKPHNVVLACKSCNNGRDAGVQLSPPKPENLAARRMTNQQLLDGVQAGTLTDAARGELYTRGLVPNWPMWSKMMATAKVPMP